MQDYKLAGDISQLMALTCSFLPFCCSSVSTKSLTVWLSLPSLIQVLLLLITQFLLLFPMAYPLMQKLEQAFKETEKMATARSLVSLFRVFVMFFIFKK
jgi:hypothetical protein